MHVKKQTNTFQIPGIRFNFFSINRTFLVREDVPRFILNDNIHACLHLSCVTKIVNMQQMNINRKEGLIFVIVKQIQFPSLAEIVLRIIIRDNFFYKRILIKRIRPVLYNNRVIIFYIIYTFNLYYKELK